MTSKFINATVLAAALALSACQAPVQHMTPSGKVEQVFQKATPDQVKPWIVEMMVSKGYNITKDTPFMVAFDRPVTNMMTAALLGSKYDSTPNARLTYTFVQIGPDVRVVVDASYITNPGSAFERVTPANGNPDTAILEQMLQQMASSHAPR